MVTNKIYNLFKDMYYFEFETRNKMNLNLKIPLTILILLFGVIAYYLRNLAIFLKFDWLSLVFFVLFVITLINIACVIYFLFRGFSGYIYAYLPKASDLYNYIEKIKQYYKHPYFKSLTKEDVEKLIEEEIDSSMTSFYLECSDFNGLSNYRKSKYLHKTSITLIITVIFILLSFIPFFIKYYSNPVIQKIEIVNPIEEGISMIQEDEKEEQEQTPKSEPPKPEKPTKPTIRKFHEGEEPSE